MDACSAVGREADKVVSKFTNLDKTINKSIDEQISQIGITFLKQIYSRCSDLTEINVSRI